MVKTILYYFGESVKDEIEILKELKFHLQTHFDEKSKDLDKKALRIKSNAGEDDANYKNDKHIYGVDDYLFGIKCVYAHILKEESMLLIVGLYRVCELNINKVLSWRYSNQKELKQLSQWDNLKKRLLRDGIDIEKISGYCEVNELRLLNNTIKHEGKVSSNLSSSYSNWKVGAEFETIELGRKSDAFSKVVPCFVLDFAIEVIPKEKQD
jgi:hypothetical protein